MLPSRARLCYDLISKTMRKMRNTAVLCAAVAVGLAGLARAEVVLSPKLAQAPRVDRGELLLSELNCVNCHFAGEAAQRRLEVRPGPVLGAVGMRITPQYLRKWLADPHAYKPGTPMPDLLHGLNGAEKEETVEALAHFLVSLHPHPATAAPGAEEHQLRHGGELFHTTGCVACHAPNENAPGATGDFRSLAPESIPLGDLARKTTADEMAKFLMDPVKVRPSGRMPSLGLSGAEAKSLAVYLLREQLKNPANEARNAALPGLRYQYYEDHLSGSPDFEKLTPKASGTVEKFDISARKREQSFGFRFSGSIHVPRPGRYTFFTTSDDGSQLFIDGKLVVDNNGDHAPEQRRGNIELTEGAHGIVVTFFNNGGGHELKVEWRGPGFERQEIPGSALSHLGRPMIPLDSVEFALDRAKVEKGREHFVKMGCASCHSAGPGVQSDWRAKGLADLDLESGTGCLSEKQSALVPKFDLSEEQRASLKATLRKRESLAEARAWPEHAKFTMARLNCYACHTRDGEGGPTDARLAFFRVEGEVDMGDEGRIPPHLTAVGGKLQQDWMREVLLNKGWVRPYMLTRMPQFGELNVGRLPQALEQADQAAEARNAPETSGPLQPKFGRKLVGTTGLSCISCHTFGEHKSLGIPALDLTTMAKRLKYDWFHRYLINPPSLRPGTRMPSFWPEGEAVNQDILDGNTDAQIAAIWAYLKEGSKADLPDGLIQGKMEIVAEKEPRIYRNFIAGAGTRAIGVGYPEKVNLAFDANNMRVAMIWQGSFIDAARHSTGRGAGFEPPLGHNVRNLPEGAPFAFLEGPDPRWPNESGKEAGYRMIGYVLDEARRPVFRYDYRGVQIEDRFTPMKGEVDNYFQREIRLQSEQPVRDLYYRAAQASTIEPRGNNSFLIDGKVILNFSGDAIEEPVMRGTDKGKELLIPIRFRGEGSFIEEIIW